MSNTYKLSLVVAFLIGGFLVLLFYPFGEGHNEHSIPQEDMPEVSRVDPNFYNCTSLSGVTIKAIRQDDKGGIGYFGTDANGFRVSINNDNYAQWRCVKK